MVLVYLAGAVLLSIFGFMDVFGNSTLYIYFASLFVVYFVASIIRDNLLSEDEKREEEDYQSWLSGQRGP